MTRCQSSFYCHTRLSPLRPMFKTLGSAYTPAPKHISNQTTREAYEHEGNSPIDRNLYTNACHAGMQLRQSTKCYTSATDQHKRVNTTSDRSANHCACANSE